MSLPTASERRAAATRQPPLTVIAFAAERWAHVLPALRLVGPAHHAGLQLIRGNAWDDGVLSAFPERVREADLVVIQRDFPANAEWYERVLAEARSAGKPVVYETDDLLTDVPEQHPDFPRYRAARLAVLQAVVEADAVTASTPALCSQLRAYNPNVWLLPNYLDDRIWPVPTPSRPTVPAESRPITVGYMGGYSHTPDIQMILPALTRLLDRFGEGLQLKLWGLNPLPELSAYPNVEATPLAIADYAEFAAFFARQSCDIFIAPLQAGCFNECKSALKFLEYSALGIPGIYSSITPYRDVVVSGRNGCLASDLAEWEEALTQLITDPALRQRLGQEAGQTVRDRWLLSKRAGEWVAVYQQILSRPPGQARPGATALRRAREWNRELENVLGAQAQATQGLREQLAAQAQAVERGQAFEAELAERERELEDANARLAEVTGSFGWRAVQAQRRLRQRLAPPGGSVDRWLTSTLEALQRQPAGGRAEKPQPPLAASQPAGQNSRLVEAGKPAQPASRPSAGRSNPGPASAPVIQLRDVSVRYRVPQERISSVKEYAIRRLKRTIAYHDFWALHGIDITVERGEVLGIIGPNGAGKSTLLKVIARVLRPTRGRAWVRGRVAPLLELGAGFDYELTGRENVFLNGTLLGYTYRDVAARFDRIVEFAGLQDFIDAPLRTYSSGMVTRLAFATATDVPPEILILDEILSVGDAEFQQKSAERIQGFREYGTTILIVSHSLAAVQTMCTRALWLDRGRMCVEGSPDAVVHQYLGQTHAVEAERLAQVAGPDLTQRQGSRAAEITRVRLTDHWGTERTIFETGQELVLHIEYEAHARITEAVFGMAIHRHDGLHLTGPNTDFAGLKLPPLLGRGSVSFSIPRLPLLEGLYQISVALHNEQDTEMYDSHERAYPFRVVNATGRVKEHYGMIALHGEWRHSAADGSSAPPKQIGST